MYRNGQRSFLSKFGARLGLLALVLQLVLSFAHIHPLPCPVTVVSAPDGGNAPELPQADGACAICATIAAFAALDLPRQDVFDPPVRAAEIVAPAIATGEHRPALIRHFSSRAPPVA